MKKRTLFVAVFLSVLVIAAAAYSDEHTMPAPPAHSKDFDFMKGFIGAWEGRTDMGKGPEAIKATYELTSAGNAIVERLFAGTNHEMVTIYHDFNGKLAMTHYCSLGNQPHMELTSSTGGNLDFSLSEKSPGLSSLKEMHMHSLRVAVDGKDSITQTWTLYDNGAKKSDVVIKLNRAKI
jgi:hypothetical protein